MFVDQYINKAQEGHWLGFVKGQMKNKWYFLNISLIKENKNCIELNNLWE